LARSWSSPRPVIKSHAEERLVVARGAPQNLGVPFSIYTKGEASDFKFGTQIGLVKVHHKITPIGKSGHGLELGELPKILWFHFNIYTMT